MRKRIFKIVSIDNIEEIVAVLKLASPWELERDCCFGKQAECIGRSAFIMTLGMLVASSRLPWQQVFDKAPKFLR